MNFHDNLPLSLLSTLVKEKIETRPPTSKLGKISHQLIVIFSNNRTIRVSRRRFVKKQMN